MVLLYHGSELALYFEEKVPGRSVFLVEDFLARNCTYLDEMVADTEITPLSAFGFADDFQNETVVWHSPEKGLKTVSELLQRLRKNSKVIEEADAAISDLEKMESRLEDACKSKIRFCFIFHYDAINGMEVDSKERPLLISANDSETYKPR